MKKITIFAILLILMGCSNEQESERETLAQAQYDSSVDETLSVESQEIYHFLLGEIALDRDQPNVAMAEYNALNETVTDPLTAARATSIAIEQDDFVAAGRSAKVWADATPTDIQTQAIATSIMLKTQNIDGAMPFLARMVTEDEKTTFDNLMVLRSTLEDEKHAKAFIELMKTYGIKHQDYRLLFIGATTAQEIKDTASATELSNEIVKINPGWMRGAVLSVQMQYESGNMDEALKSIARLIKDNPNEGMYRYLQAKMLLEKGDMDAGVRALNALKADPKYRNEALMDLARVSVQNQDYENATIFLNQYLSYEPESDEAKYFSGYVAQNTGKYDVALAQFTSVKPGFYYVNANIQAAMINAAKGNVNQALGTLDGLMKAYPKEKSRIELVKTQVLLDGNRVEEAYESLNAILNANAKDTELRYIRGLIGMELGHTAQAETDLRYVVSSEPNHIEAINDLSSLLISQNNFDEAHFYIEQALRLAPNNAKSLDNMGWLLHQQGQAEASVAYLKKAHAVSDDDVIAAHLGQALWNTGNRKDAIDVWNKALETHPNDPVLIEVMREHVVTPASN